MTEGKGRRCVPQEKAIKGSAPTPIAVNVHLFTTVATAT